MINGHVNITWEYRQGELILYYLIIPGEFTEKSQDTFFRVGNYLVFQESEDI